MNDAQELRKKAARARRAANTRTEGGHSADTQLLELAKLEQSAEEQEREEAKMRDKPRRG
jgi:hypothetical protein